MNASLLDFSVFRDRYTKPLVSGQRVICTFPPPLGSAPRAASLSPDNAVHRFLYPLLSSSKNKEINQVFLFVSCNLGYRHFKTPSPCWLYRQRGGGRVGKRVFLPKLRDLCPCSLRLTPQWLCLRMARGCRDGLTPPPGRKASPEPCDGRLQQLSLTSKSVALPGLGR